MDAPRRLAEWSRGAAWKPFRSLQGTSCGRLGASRAPLEASWDFGGIQGLRGPLDAGGVAVVFVVVVVVVVLVCRAMSVDAADDVLPPKPLRVAATQAGHARTPPSPRSRAPRHEKGRVSFYTRAGPATKATASDNSTSNRDSSHTYGYPSLGSSGNQTMPGPRTGTTTKF